MERSWILIGMMGAGKSAVGEALAKLSGRSHLDTDRMLVQRLGRPIPQLFSIYGEPAFRDHETSVLRSLQPGASVISTGGGIVVRPANWDELRRLGIVIFLDLDPELIKKRIRASKKKRPLLAADDWEGRFESILDGRRELYEQADLIVRLEDEPLAMCAARVLHAIHERFPPTLGAC